jgi:hypothetical protein
MAASEIRSDIQYERDQTSALEKVRLLKDGAMDKARSHYAKAKAAVVQNVREVKEAASDVTHSNTGRERWKAFGRTCNVLLTGEPARILARLLICSYYINLVFSELEAWQQLQIESQRHPPHVVPRTVPFPYTYVFGVLPVAVLTALSLFVPWLWAGLLVGFTVWHDAFYTWMQLKHVVTIQ